MNKVQHIHSFVQRHLLDPFKAFLHDSRAIGIILLVCTCCSLVIANWPGLSSYVDFWASEIHLLESFLLPHSILHWINDGLMALFFFLVGMEIKRELVVGELSSIQKAILPAVAAVGGMLAPALIFTILNKGSVYSGGWAIPTATDIAFSLGIASLLGNRVPASLKIFLMALAIIDDLGAIIVIALFYGAAVKLLWLAACIVIVALLVFLLKKSKKAGLLHFVLGLLLWYCMFNSGVHATVAGVVFAFLMPTAQLTRFELKMHTPVYFFIMPVFALANTAIIFPNDIAHALQSSLSWGIMLGLFIGKPLGICLTCYYLVKRKIAVLPAGVNWKHMIGAGILAGIGFTMSIFISTLAFASKEMQDVSKISVLIVSGISMLVGYLWLKKMSPATGKLAT